MDVGAHVQTPSATNFLIRIIGIAAAVQRESCSNIPVLVLVGMLLLLDLESTHPGFTVS
jgi:hypothetical protein